jgi:Fe2+ or Zn2+ uptake regulation protein
MLEAYATIADIQARVHFLDLSINRSKVYRALAVVTELGFVTEATMSEGKICLMGFEIKKPHSFHHGPISSTLSSIDSYFLSFLNACSQ